MYYELTDCFVVAADLAKTWHFFSAADNLPKVTPPSLTFEIKSQPVGGIKQDSLLDYTIRFASIPIRWRTRIIDWSPPRQFIDLQIRGPYALWHHQHRFEQGENGVVCSDRVTYRLPFGPMGRLAHASMVQRQLLQIFRFRRKAVAEALGWEKSLQDDVMISRIK